MIDTSSYDVKADVDFDGDVDANDKSIAEAGFSGIELGHGSLSQSEVNNRMSRWAGGSLVGAVLDVRLGGRKVILHTALGRSLHRPKELERPSWEQKPGGFSGYDEDGNYICAYGCEDEDPCEKACKDWKKSNPCSVGATVCAGDGKGTKCPCVGSIPGMSCGLMSSPPLTSDFADAQKGGPPPASFMDAFAECAKLHEQAHVDGPSECEDDAAAGSTPSYPQGSGGYKKDEAYATQVTQACMLGLDCKGDAKCQQWKDALKGRGDCKIAWGNGQQLPDGCVFPVTGGGNAGNGGTPK